MIKNSKNTVPIKNNQFQLSEREIEILKLVAEGKTNSQIAKEVKISIHTVKAHVANILLKLDVKYRLQAAVKAITENIINI